MDMISKADIEEFHDKGFLVVKNCFSNFEIKQPNDWEQGKEMAYYETSKNNSKRIIMRVENYVDYHKIFYDFVYSKKILGVIEQVMGEEFILFKDKINFKKPGGGGFRPHQDVQARWDDFAKYTMSIMISTDRSTTENGCLEVAPGQHKRGIIGKYDRPLEGDDLNGMKFEMVPTEIGDVLFFDHFTPHQSKPNMSDKPRSNIYLTYNLLSEGDHRNEYLDKKRREFPPDNERKDGLVIKNSAIHEAKYKKN